MEIMASIKLGYIKQMLSLQLRVYSQYQGFNYVILHRYHGFNKETSIYKSEIKYEISQIYIYKLKFKI